MNQLNAAVDEVLDSYLKHNIAVDPVSCRHCSEPIEFTRGKAFIGWGHTNGHMCCANLRGIVAEPGKSRREEYVFSGTLITDLQRIARVNRDKFLSGQERWEAHKDWAKVYFETGELIIPAWEVVVRVRQRLCDGANDDGELSDGAAAAYYDLQPIQEELEMGE